MSEAQKPVETPVVAPPAATEATPVEQPTVESKPAETVEPATETPAVTEPATEEAAPVKEEVKPVEEGILGYKGPGLIKGFMFQKKFFWFGSEPVEHKSLSSYLRGEKPEVGNHNAAWAAHTGKGLLLFSKKASEKATPSGLFNLSEITDIAEEGTIAFSFNSAGHKYTFESSTLADRDNWVATLKLKAAEAKESVESVKASEEYTKTHSTLSKPAVVAASTPKKSTEVKKEEVKPVEAKEETPVVPAVAEEKKEEKAARKSRSASRKRASIFGSIGFGGKKEETKPVETKEETSVVPAAIEEPAPAPAATEPAAAIVEPTPATTEAAPVVPAVETTDRPTPAKRNSIFGTLKSQFSGHKEKKPETEAAPVVPAKDTTEPEAVSETAPIIPAVESTKPLTATDAAPATVPTTETETPATNGEAKTETAAVKADKRKSSLPWLSKKKEVTSSDEDTEKPKSPFAKLRATVKGKTSPKADKTSEKVSEPVAEPAKTEEIPAAVEPVEPKPVTTATPQVAATA